MASQTGPDLSVATAAVEALMDDTCTITRDASGELVMSQETGDIADPANTDVYSGKCKIKLLGSARESDPSDYELRRWQLGIPISAPPLIIGDRIVLTSSRRDPQLVDRKFRVSSVGGGTMAVSRRVNVEEYGL